MEYQKNFFKIGTAFASLCSFLTTKDKIRLSQTCSIIRRIVLNANNWGTFRIQDYQIEQNWENFLNWVQKYIIIIQPYYLSVMISENHEEDSRLKNIFCKIMNQVKKLTIKSTDIQLYFIIIKACPRIQHIVFQSSIISDELCTVLLKNLCELEQLEIAVDATSFSGKGLKDYIIHPLRKIILKPYMLDFQQFLIFIKNKQIVQLQEVELDVEECDQQLLYKIIDQLENIVCLRLYHMQKFSDGNLLSDKFHKTIKELTLTKAYIMPMQSIIQKISCESLLFLDLSQSLFLNDQNINYLTKNAKNLRAINLSWCQRVGNKGVLSLVHQCLSLQRLIINGLKSLDDQAFSQYLQLKKIFLNQYYDKIKYKFSKLPAKNNRQEQQLYYNNFEQQAKNKYFFRQTFHQPKCLRLIRLIDCNSCNNVSDQILKIIYCFNRMSKMINYYGQDMGLLKSNEDQF